MRSADCSRARSVRHQFLDSHKTRGSPGLCRVPDVLDLCPCQKRTRYCSPHTPNHGASVRSPPIYEGLSVHNRSPQMTIAVIVAISFMATILVIISIVRESRHRSMDQVVGAIERLDTDGLSKLADRWENSPEMDIRRGELLAAVGGLRGFLRMRKNVRLVLRLTEMV